MANAGHNLICIDPSLEIELRDELSFSSIHICILATTWTSHRPSAWDKTR